MSVRSAVVIGACTLACVIAHRSGAQVPAYDASATRPATFDALRQRAEAARAARRLDEAIALYREAIGQRPDWSEGHWYLGTIAYETAQYSECRESFGRLVRLQTENGAAWAFKGLCEFQLGNHATALEDLAKAQRLGLGDSAQLVSVTRYHFGILLTRFEQFERALQVYGAFARDGNNSPIVIEAMGLAVLRVALLPSELPADKRDMVQLAGRATLYVASNLIEPARKGYEELVQRYPDAANVHYLYGLFLLHEYPDRALDQFKEELRHSPNHALAMVQIAQELVKRGDVDGAAPWAVNAVQIAPLDFVGRRVLGQIKLERNDTAGAIAELEAAVKLQPDSPSVHFILARAYQRAGRNADAERARAEFTRLERLLRLQRGGVNAVGDPDSKSGATPPK